jgi:hypothetical protein
VSRRKEINAQPLGGFLVTQRSFLPGTSISSRSFRLRFPFTIQKQVPAVRDAVLEQGQGVGLACIHAGANTMEAPFIASSTMK